MMKTLDDWDIRVNLTPKQSKRLLSLNEVLNAQDNIWDYLDIKRTFHRHINN